MRQNSQNDEDLTQLSGLVGGCPPQSQMLQRLRHNSDARDLQVWVCMALGREPTEK